MLMRRCLTKSSLREEREPLLSILGEGEQESKAKSPAPSPKFGRGLG
jgi:hypothetical protein